MGSLRVCVPLLAFVLASSLVGERSAQGAAISPDGKALALETGSGLVVKGGRLANVISVPASEGAHDPVWSPDGNSLAFAVGSGATAHGGVFSLKTGRTSALPLGFGGPFSWREDSLRLAGVTTQEDGSVEVSQYHVTERGMTLSTSLPGVRTVARSFWITDTDDVAVLSGAGDVLLVESGQVTTVSQSHDVIGLGMAAQGRELIWARRSANPRYILCTLYRFDLKTRSVARLPFPSRVLAVNPDPRTGPTRVDSVWFSGDSTRLAVVGTQPLGSGTITTVFVTTPTGAAAQVVAKVSGEPAISVSWSDAAKQLVCSLVASGRISSIIAGGDGSSPAPLATK